MPQLHLEDQQLRNGASPSPMPSSTHRPRPVGGNSLPLDTGSLGRVRGNRGAQAEPPKFKSRLLGFDASVLFLPVKQELSDELVRLLDLAKQWVLPLR